MVDQVIINLTATDRYLHETLVNNQCAISILLDKIGKAGLGDKTTLLIKGDEILPSMKSLAKPIGCKWVVKENWTSELILKEFLSGDGKLILYLMGDAPFYDFSLIEKMVKRHRYLSVQFSNGDGYPLGIVAEILSSNIVPALIALSTRKAGKCVQLEAQCQLFDLIMTDINSFDIETILPFQDFSLLRIQLLCRGLENYLIVKQLAQQGALLADAQTLCHEILNNPQFLRTRPAFYSIQITEQCPHNCSCCPWPEVRGDCTLKGKQMSVEQVGLLAKKISDFSHKAVVSISLWGDPAFHTHIEEVIEEICKYEGLTLLIETAGIGWDATLLERIAKRWPSRIIWITSLDGFDPEVYQSIRGEGYQEAVETAKLTSRLFGDKAYQQALRLKENEADLENFWNYWNEHGQPLVQKYDWFCAKLAQKKVVDLAPLKRFPCWHLKRDISILFDGNIPLCREDLYCKVLLGNGLTDKFEDIFNAGDKYYKEQCLNKYKGICENCDEYYTYNF